MDNNRVGGRETYQVIQNVLHRHCNVAVSFDWNQFHKQREEFLPKVILKFQM